MSSDIPTGKNYPPSIRSAALGIARDHLGEKEQEGANCGPIVRWSVEGLGGREGQKWCAYFVSQCLRQACLAQNDSLASGWRLLASGDCDVLLRRLYDAGWAWRRGGLLPETLRPPETSVPAYARRPDCEDRGEEVHPGKACGKCGAPSSIPCYRWIWSKGSLTLPDEGDLVFFSSSTNADDMNHVGIVSRHADLRMEHGDLWGRIEVLSGNSGRQTNMVTKQSYDLAKTPTVSHFARVPW